MKRSSSVIVAVIVVLVLIGGGYALMRKSSNATPTTTTTKTSTPTTVKNSVFTIKTSSSLGQYLTDLSGKALYTYGADSSGVSNCTGTCLANWPAYQASRSTTNLPTDVSTLKRTDNGQTQYTYRGLPLYYFVNDGQGQVTGNGINKFQVAKPASTTSTQSTTTPSTATPSTSNPASGQPY